MATLYTAQATVLGGRCGRASSCDGRLRVDLSAPAALGGDDGRGTNPEQLFAAAYAACFLTTVRREAEAEGLTLAREANATATVRLIDAEDGDGDGDGDGGGTPVLAICLSLDLPGVSFKAAEALAERAHARCPYSRAMQGNVAVRIRVT